MNLKKSLIKKIGEYIETPSIFWDRDSELSEDQMLMIFKTSDGLNEVENELYDWNLDYIIDLEYQAVHESCKKHWNEFPIKIQKQYDWDFEEFWNENESKLRDLFLDYVGVDMDIKTLISNSSIRPVLKTSITFYVGDHYDAKYRDFKDLLDVLEYNPYEFAMATGLNPISFPNILSRKTPKSSFDYFVQLFKETKEGELVLLLNDGMDIEKFARDWDLYHGQIGLTNVTACFYDYYDGGYSNTFSMKDFVLDYRIKNFNYEHCSDADMNRGRDFTTNITLKSNYHVSRNQSIKKRIPSQRASVA